jgi:hypothetical protein
MTLCSQEVEVSEEIAFYQVAHDLLLRMCSKGFLIVVAPKARASVKFMFAGYVVATRFGYHIASTFNVNFYFSLSSTALTEAKTLVMHVSHLIPPLMLKSKVIINSS